MSAGITFGGLASGLDTASIINQLMSLERRPIVRLQEKQFIYESQASKLRSYKTRVGKLEDAAAALGERRDVLTTTASSSDEDVFTARSFGGAPVGASSVHVTRLATEQKTYSNPFADASAAGAFGTGTLTLQVGSDDAVDVAIEAGDSLESVVDKINASGADVTAGLLYDGTDYRLRITGDQTGQDRAISFTETGVSLGLSDPANTIQAAEDARFHIDGFEMTRSRNTFSDAIDGVSITLVGESPSAAPATLEVERDDESLRSKVQSFVAAYNEVMGAINAEFTYSGSPKGPDSLSGDSTLRGLQNRLRARVADRVGGLSGERTTLASIGITSQNDGTLQIDDTVLNEALESDARAVADLFAGDGAGAEGFVAQLTADLALYNDDADGALAGRIDSLEGRSRDVDDQIDRLELRLDKTEERLTAQYAELEQIVSGLQNQGNQILSVLSGL